MVQQCSEKTDEFRPVPAQDSSGDDGDKIKEVDDKVLPRDGVGSGGASEFH